MTDINEFLSQRTQLCERQHARITPAQCQTCRDRGDAFCIGCAGLVPTYPLSIVQEEVEVSKKKVEPCAMCHRTMEIAGRGMCGKCYSVELKREKSSKNAPPLKPVIADSGFNPTKAAVTVPDPVEAEPPAEFEPDTERESEHLLGCAQDDSPVEWVPIDLRQARSSDMREMLRSDAGRIVTIPNDLAEEWRNSGLSSEHVLGLMELHLNGELMIRRYL